MKLSKTTFPFQHNTVALFIGGRLSREYDDGRSAQSAKRGCWNRVVFYAKTEKRSLTNSRMKNTIKKELNFKIIVNLITE